MYIDEVPNRNSPPAILLREGHRQGNKIVKRTVANLSNWPRERIESLRLLLKGEKLVPLKSGAITVKRTVPQGHVDAVLRMTDRLGLPCLISSKPCKERDLVVAMIVQRILQPSSKLAMTRLWHDTALACRLGVEEADCEDVYEALDWLLVRQQRIENKLSRRHLQGKDSVLYDLTSSYYEGRTCPLAVYGHDRDGSTGCPIIVYGVLTDRQGRPLSVDVYPGNTADCSTVPEQVEKLRQRFDLEQVVLVGDRGCLTGTQLKILKQYPGLGWITALRSEAIRRLIEDGEVHRSLFDENHLAEIVSPEYPGERLVVCYNPLLADERKRKRGELLAATEKKLTQVLSGVARRTRTPMTESQIGVRVGKVLGQYKMAKHFTVTIAPGCLEWTRNAASIQLEESLDGIYIIRTSESAEALSAEDAVRIYKSLSQVERTFRLFKGIDDLQVRPIRHRVEERVRAHIFVCLLAYYVEWHLRRAWASLLFEDEDLPGERARRDPVAPAQATASASRKKQIRLTPEGFAVHSFKTLLVHLATRTKIYGHLKITSGEGLLPQALAIPIDELSELTALQARAFQLLELFPVDGISK